MIICAMRRQKGWWVVLFVTVLFVMAGCADVKPHQPRNHREEGSQGGIFTGPGGEWVIYRADEPAPGAEKKKKAETAADAGQPASDSQNKSQAEAAPESEQP